MNGHAKYPVIFMTAHDRLCPKEYIILMVLIKRREK
jgi:hypothetical protein